MRIGMVVDMYKPHVSGITSYVVLNKKWLESRGHQVYVFTLGNEEYRDDEPNVIRSPGFPINVNDTDFFLSFRFSERAEELLLTMDVVHCHHPFLTGPMAVRLCEPVGIPLLYTNHTRLDLYAEHYIPPPFVGFISGPFLQTYMPVFCQQFNEVVSPSAGMARILRDFGVEQPIRVAPNGVDLQPFANPPALDRAAYGLPADHVVLMYVGRLSPEKNLPFLLEAFARAVTACPNLTLAIVGGGNELESLQQLAAELELTERQVRFLGRIPYETIPSILRLADAFVTASITEVHPFTLIEAMASGLPGVGIESPGISDTLTHRRNGLLSKHDLAGFTAQLVVMGLDAPLRRALSAHAKADAVFYDINRTGALMLEIYESLINQPRQKRLKPLEAFQRTWRDLLTVPQRLALPGINPMPPLPVLPGSGRLGLGHKGERLAETHLEQKGYKIITRNHRTPFGEIDLVAQKDGAWVFVEVKTRRSAAFGAPEEAIGARKRKHLLAAARHYLSQHSLHEVNWRIDVVAIEMSWRGQVKRIELIENAIGD